jgi:hypothetical protein
VQEDEEHTFGDIVKDPRRKTPETPEERRARRKREKEGGGEDYLKQIYIEDEEAKKERKLRERREERQKRQKKMEKDRLRKMSSKEAELDEEF